MKKKIFIIALCILLTGCFESKSSKGTKGKTKKANEYESKCKGKTGVVDVDINKYTNIYDYIMDQKDLRIEVENYNDEGPYRIKLTDEEIKSFFDNMKKNKVYIGKSGLDGGAVPFVYIFYTRNKEEKNVSIFDIYAISNSNDINIYRILDENIEVKIDARDAKLCEYVFDSFDKTVYEYKE